MPLLLADNVLRRRTKLRAQDAATAAAWTAGSAFIEVRTRSPRPPVGTHPLLGTGGQHTIMPPAHSPLQVAVRYRPAESETLVGGDCYDTVVLPGSRRGPPRAFAFLSHEEQAPATLVGGCRPAHVGDVLEASMTSQIRVRSFSRRPLTGWVP
jgi:hypothetical protein